MYYNERGPKGGYIAAEWDIDDNGDTVPGSVVKYPEGKVKTEKELLPRMDRIMRYGE